MQAVAPSFKGCGSFHSLTVRSVINTVKLFCIFCDGPFFSGEAGGESISWGGGLEQAPCWGSISTARILKSVFLSLQIQRTC